MSRPRSQASASSRPNTGGPSHSTGAVVGDVTITDVNVLQDLIDGGVINIDDITLNDVDLGDLAPIVVEDVLINNQIRVLSNLLNRSPILSDNQDFLRHHEISH